MIQQMRAKDAHDHQCETNENLSDRMHVGHCSQLLINEALWSCWFTLVVLFFFLIFFSPVSKFEKNKNSPLPTLTMAWLTLLVVHLVSHLFSPCLSQTQDPASTSAPTASPTSSGGCSCAGVSGCDICYLDFLSSGTGSDDGTTISVGSTCYNPHITISMYSAYGTLDTSERLWYSFQADGNTAQWNVFENALIDSESSCENNIPITTGPGSSGWDVLIWYEVNNECAWGCSGCPTFSPVAHYADVGDIVGLDAHEGIESTLEVYLYWAVRFGDNTDFSAAIELFCSNMPPTSSPTPIPSDEPTNDPSMIPTTNPTLTPTKMPTIMPSEVPTSNPTHFPSKSPTNRPTRNPVIPGTPSASPTNEPTTIPTIPTNNPSIFPSNIPSVYPSVNPSNNPTIRPTNQPISPTNVPTIIPSLIPTNIPSNSPTEPTAKPTKYPTKRPTNRPTSLLNETLDASDEEIVIIVDGSDSSSSNGSKDDSGLNMAIMALMGLCLCLSIIGVLSSKKYRQLNEEIRKQKAMDVRMRQMQMIKRQVTKDREKAMSFDKNDQFLTEGARMESRRITISVWEGKPNNENENENQTNKNNNKLGVTSVNGEIGDVWMLSEANYERFGEQYRIRRSTVHNNNNKKITKKSAKNSAKNNNSQQASNMRGFERVYSINSVSGSPVAAGRSVLSASIGVDQREIGLSVASMGSEAMYSNEGHENINSEDSREVTNGVHAMPATNTTNRMQRVGLGSDAASSISIGIGSDKDEIKSDIIAFETDGNDKQMKQKKESINLETDEESSNSNVNFNDIFGDAGNNEINEMINEAIGSNNVMEGGKKEVNTTNEEEMNEMMVEESDDEGSALFEQNENDADNLAATTKNGEIENENENNIGLDLNANEKHKDSNAKVTTRGGAGIRRKHDTTKGYD